MRVGKAEQFSLSLFSQPVCTYVWTVLTERLVLRRNYLSCLPRSLPLARSLEPTHLRIRLSHLAKTIRLAGQSFGQLASQYTPSCRPSWQSNTWLPPRLTQSVLHSNRRVVSPSSQHWLAQSASCHPQLDALLWPLSLLLLLSSQPPLLASWTLSLSLCRRFLYLSD